MRVSLNIAEDKELRDAVREIIEGQVKVVVRERLPELVGTIVKAELERKLAPMVQQTCHVAVRDAVVQHMRTYKGIDLAQIIRDRVADLFVDRFGSKQ